MLRVGIYRPVGVLTANHVVTHTIIGQIIDTNGVGVNSAQFILRVFSGPQRRTSRS